MCFCPSILCKARMHQIFNATLFYYIWTDFVNTAPARFNINLIKKFLSLFVFKLSAGNHKRRYTFRSD